MSWQLVYNILGVGTVPYFLLMAGLNIKLGQFGSAAMNFSISLLYLSIYVLIGLCKLK